MEKEMIEYLEAIAKKEALFDDMDDFDILGASGGNFDDAYQFGCDDGEISLARNLLKKYKEKQ